MNCIKIGLPGKTDSQSVKRSSGNHILLKIVSENRFSWKTYFYTIHPWLGPLGPLLPSRSGGGSLAFVLLCVRFGDRTLLAIFAFARALQYLHPQPLFVLVLSSTLILVIFYWVFHLPRDLGWVELPLLLLPNSHQPSAELGRQ